MIIVICKTQFNLWISLQAMDKHFELMLYPNERHGVGFPKWIHAQREYVKFWFKNFLGKDFVKE